MIGGAWVLSLSLATARTELTKWFLIAEDLGSSLPAGAVALNEAAMATSYWPIVVFAIAGCLSLIVVLRGKTNAVFFAWCGIVLLVVAGVFGFAVWQLQRLDPWLAGEMEVSLPLTVERAPESLAVFLSEEQPRADRIQAARTLRTIGLKHAAGLLRVDSTVTRPLIELAADESADAEMRFFAAFALTRFDHASDSARQAIHSANQAALQSEDSELRALVRPDPTLP
ncbi:hypothetical protein [Lignipirellula cremea]|uniref:hypothetical protein n=1 Tax=Lignipirellula cremea TaxID=2528010 RepID=UPI00119D8C41|nr:hypothetical protein [Lignipirellula cremea]